MSIAPRFDSVIHAPNRLQICALLAPTDSVDFFVLREALQVTDSVVSKHLRILHEAGYVSIKKSVLNSRTRTRARITSKGRRAYRSHIAELQRLVQTDADAPMLAAE